MKAFGARQKEFERKQLVSSAAAYVLFAILAGGAALLLSGARASAANGERDKAVAELKSGADGKAVIAQMKKTPTDDPLFGKGTIRVDGRKIHPAYLVEVKKPSESKGPYDYYKVLATIPADQAFRPLADGGCELVKK